MKTFNLISLGALICTLSTAAVSCSRSDEARPAANVKPYPLDTCLVCDMKLAEMQHPCVFTYRDREIKVCDKGEQKDFEKEPATYLKKLEEAEAKSKK